MFIRYKHNYVESGLNMMTARRLKNWFVVLVIAVVGIATNKLMLSLVTVLLLRIALTLTDIKRVTTGVELQHR